MAKEEARRVVLLSIKPKFADAIIAGAKRVEFRRTRCRADIDAAIVYATAPRMKVVGYFEVARIEELPPLAAWRKYGRVGGTSREEFDQYYAGALRAVVISIGQVICLPTARRLGTLGPRITRPPQSFQYLPSRSLQRLDPAFVAFENIALAKIALG